MSWLRKTRPVLVVLGLGTLVATVAGARALTNGQEPKAGGGSGGASDKTLAPKPGGTVVLGTVDTETPQVEYGLPPVLAAGTIAKVFVKDGFAVKAGDPLYEFDTTVQRGYVERAKSAVAYAKTKVAEAKELAGRHTSAITLAEFGVKKAQSKVQFQLDNYRLVERKIESAYQANKFDESTWPERKKGDSDLYKANVDYQIALLEKEFAEKEVAQLKAVNPQVKVDEAEAAVKQAETEQANAEAAVELCTLRAKTDGTIEQVTVGAGKAMGMGTRQPALWLIPSGPRIVRAEVEADFVHRIGANPTGRAVTVTDDANANLKYAGTIKRVGSTFLRKRSAADALVSSETRVIEVEVEIADAAPANQPPLLVGQRVRVHLGK
jgi:multidrug resistance efflux pump